MISACAPIQGKVRAMRKSLPLVVLLAAAAFVPSACGKKDPIVPSLSVDAGFAFGGDAGATEGGADGAAPDAAAPLASAVPSGSVAPAGSAPPALLGPALDSAIDVGIQAQAAKDAPGMSLEGQVGHATLAEGGTHNMLVTLQPGRCYTVIAMSAPLQVTQLEVKLLAPPLFNVEAGRSAAGDKNPAVLGKGKGATCPISPIAIPYRVDVIARKGAGRIGVALLSRAK
jgi:hypothetical protein